MNGRLLHAGRKQITVCHLMAWHHFQPHQCRDGVFTIICCITVSAAVSAKDQL